MKMTVIGHLTGTDDTELTHVICNNREEAERMFVVDLADIYDSTPEQIAQRGYEIYVILQGHCHHEFKGYKP